MLFNIRYSCIYIIKIQPDQFHQHQELLPLLLYVLAVFEKLHWLECDYADQFIEQTLRTGGFHALGIRYCYCTSAFRSEGSFDNVIFCFDNYLCMVLSIPNRFRRLILLAAKNSHDCIENTRLAGSVLAGNQNGITLGRYFNGHQSHKVFCC